MAGTAVTPAPASGILSNGGGGGGGGNSVAVLSNFISERVSGAMDELSHHLYANRSTTSKQFLMLLLSLARAIDYAIGNNGVPSRSQELPSLVKPLVEQVRQNKNETYLKATIMVLMVSIKNACQIGWFSDGDSEELSNLAKEMATSFCSVPNFNTDPSNNLSLISTVMSRFYPRLKMGHIFAYLDVKPGFDSYVRDFHISKDKKPSPGDRIRLFVVQMDNIETSSCLVSPAKVNFLLNGKGVEMRTNLSMDTGPQMPTIVRHVLKYGTNMLQAVGEFNGNYMIAVAFMSEVPNPDKNVLQDYEQHASATVDSDSELIVGPSRISLNCPISFKKIKSPVKGHSCKHIQCFDFDNYVDINSRRPSWRCPHCNQHVCFTDIRIDKKMVEILEDSGPNNSDVIITSDGSWNAVMESDDTIQKPNDTTTSYTGRYGSPQPADVLDLTQIDDLMDDIAPRETEDRKHVQNSNRHFMTQTTATNPPITTANTNDSNQSSGQVGSTFWSNIFLSTFDVESSNVGPNAQVSSAIDTLSAPQSETSLPNTLQLEQYQFGSQPVTNEYGRFPSMPRNVTRTATAIQALPAQQAQTSRLQRSYSANAITPNGSSAASQGSPAAPNFSTASRAHPRQNLGTQQNIPYPSTRPPHQTAGFQGPNLGPNTHRISNERHNSSQPMTALRIRHPISQSPVPVQSSPQSSNTFLHPQSTQQSELIAAANRMVQMSVDSSRTVPPFSRNPEGRNMMTSPWDQRSNLGPTPQPVARTDGHDPTAEMNWRPAGRMRGALSGQAYTDAYNQFMSPARPNQQAQGVRPITNMTPVPTNVPVQGIPAPNNLAPGSVSSPMGLDVLPGGPFGIK